MTNLPLAGRVAIVTGAAGAIGGAAVRVLAERGARVAAVDRPGCDLSALAREVAPESFLAVEADVTDEAAVKAYVQRALSAFGGRIDIFFNNAGVLGPIGSLVDYPLEAFRTVFQVNVEGVFLGLKHVLPPMIAQGSGSIVNSSSIAGLSATPGVCAYTASKHAVIGLTKSAAVEAAPHGVRVNCVNPGPIVGPMINAVDGARNADHERRAQIIPARRYGRPEEVARLVAFLASDDASYVNGAVHSVDGALAALRAT